MSQRRTRLVLGLAGSLCGLFVMGASGTAHAQAKIAIVNFQRAIEESTEGKTAIGNLKGQVDRKQKELEAKKEELKKLDEELAKLEASGVLKPDALQKKKQELQAKFQQLQQAAMRAQQELGEQESKVTGPLQEKVLRAVAQIAQRDKFTLVLRSEMVLYPTQSEYDITNEVLRKVNEMGGTPRPATATPPAGGPK